VSPSSIYETLLLAYFGSGGETESELSEVLGFNAENATATKDEVKKSYLFRRAFQVETC
jgi:serine protease inhibitor